MRTVAMRLLVSTLLLAGGCRSTGPTAPGPPAPALRAGPPAAPGRARPARIIAPRGVSGPRPVLLALHGYGDTGMGFAAGLGLPDFARRAGFVLVVPDGTPDPDGARFWNAGAACCNFFSDPVDDVAYLRGLLREVMAAHPVDPRRVYVLGFSNGGFMAHRLACEAADDIAAIVSISGTTDATPAPCRPARPVSVLQVHGDADGSVEYDGGRDILGRRAGAYLGAVATVDLWARRNGCRGPRAGAPERLDLDRFVPGPETDVQRTAACPPGIDVTLFTIRGASHLPAFAPAFVETAWQWLMAHPQPTGGR
jgi:polyhydroxybutyrate depolymerase